MSDKRKAIIGCDVLGNAFVMATNSEFIRQYCEDDSAMLWDLPFKSGQQRLCPTEGFWLWEGHIIETSHHSTVFDGTLTRFDVMTTQLLNMFVETGT